MLARVVAVADSFDAMTSTRSYSRARPVQVALTELERCAGAQFDPAMVRALVTAIGRHGWHPVVTSDDDLQVIGAGTAAAGTAAAGPAGTAAAALPALPAVPAQPPGLAADRPRGGGGPASERPAPGSR